MTTVATVYHNDVVFLTMATLSLTAPDYSKSIGEILTQRQEELKSQGFTQGQIAEEFRKLGIRKLSQQTISKYANNPHTLSTKEPEYLVGVFLAHQFNQAESEKLASLVYLADDEIAERYYFIKNQED